MTAATSIYCRECNGKGYCSYKDPDNRYAPNIIRDCYVCKGTGKIAPVVSVAPAVQSKAAPRRIDRCARCGQPADWVAGAGEYLCERHEDSY